MTTLAELDGTRWTGKNELWLDPLGNDAKISEATMHVAGNVVHYTWVYEGEPHRGTVTLEAEGAVFADTWHAKDPIVCRKLDTPWGIFQVEGTYGGTPPWGWRIALVLRDRTGELVLQMTNITSWGEEGRAVRLVATRDA